MRHVDVSKQEINHLALVATSKRVDSVRRRKTRSPVPPCTFPINRTTAGSSSTTKTDAANRYSSAASSKFKRSIRLMTRSILRGSSEKACSSDP